MEEKNIIGDFPVDDDYYFNVLLDKYYNYGIITDREFFYHMKRLSIEGHKDALITYMRDKDADSDLILELIEKYHKNVYSINGDARLDLSWVTKYFLLYHKKCYKRKDKEIEQLKSKIQELEEQLYTPGNQGYLDVQKHFIQVSKPRRNSF